MIIKAHQAEVNALFYESTRTNANPRSPANVYDRIWKFSHVNFLYEGVVLIARHGSFRVVFSPTAPGWFLASIVPLLCLQKEAIKSYGPWLNGTHTATIQFCIWWMVFLSKFRSAQYHVTEHRWHTAIEC